MEARQESKSLLDSWHNIKLLRYSHVARACVCGKTGVLGMN